METLIINIPEKKSTLVKQILKGLGVTIQKAENANFSAYKQKIAKVSTWTEEDLKIFEESRNAFNNFTPQKW